MDFLTRLAARAVARETIVRPRPMSLFELHPSDNLPRDSSETFAELSAEMPAAGERRRAPELRFGREVRTPSAVPEVMSHPRQAAKQHGLAAPSAAPRDIPPAPPQPPTLPAERRPQPAPMRDQNQVESEATKPWPPPSGLDRPATVMGKIETPRDAAKSSPAIEPGPKPPPVIERIVRQEAVPYQSTREPVPAAGPRRTRRAPDPLRPAAPAPPVSIEVTIGRVEVRAVAPPSPPKSHSARRPAPALSLDDYLKQRNGGRS